MRIPVRVAILVVTLGLVGTSVAWAAPTALPVPSPANRCDRLFDLTDPASPLTDPDGLPGMVDPPWGAVRPWRHRRNVAVRSAVTTAGGWWRRASAASFSQSRDAPMVRSVDRGMSSGRSPLAHRPMTRMIPAASGLAVRRSIKFRVDARLTVDPAPAVAFDTILEMGSSTYLVTPAAE